MTNQQVIQEWIGSTEAAIEALRGWLDCLKRWEYLGSQVCKGDFDAALRELIEAGFLDWVDSNPSDIDALARTVTRVEP